MELTPALTQKARGILLLMAAVGCFGAVDGFSKILVDTQSFGQIMLARYTRNIYQWPGIRGTVNVQNIKGHYYTSHPTINPTRIVPGGPVLDFDGRHGRSDQFGQGSGFEVRAGSK